MRHKSNHIQPYAFISIQKVEELPFGSPYIASIPFQGMALCMVILLNVHSTCILHASTTYVNMEDATNSVGLQDMASFVDFLMNTFVASLDLHALKFGILSMKLLSI